MLTPVSGLYVDMKVNKNSCVSLSVYLKGTLLRPFTSDLFYELLGFCLETPPHRIPHKHQETTVGLLSDQAIHMALER